MRIRDGHVYRAFQGFVRISYLYIGGIGLRPHPKEQIQEVLIVAIKKESNNEGTFTPNSVTKAGSGDLMKKTEPYTQTPGGDAGKTTGYAKKKDCK